MNILYKLFLLGTIVAIFTGILLNKDSISENYREIGRIIYVAFILDLFITSITWAIIVICWILKFISFIISLF